MAPVAGDPTGSTGATQSVDAPMVRRVRWARLGWLPYLLLGAFVGYWALTHTGAVISGARSWRAVAFGVGAGLLTVIALLGVARLTRRGWAGQLAGLVPLVVAVTLAVLPSYLPSTVNEAAPEGLTAAAAPPVSAAPDADTGTTAAPSVDPSSSPGSEASEPAGPIELSTGQFVGIDHDAVGSARLIQLEGGSLVVRFEQFSVEAGPDYDVYVISGAARAVPDGGTRLGDLKGTAGDQNYEIPAGAIPAAGVEAVTILIWCEIFAVPVANATL